ncbi:MAG: ATP-binding protein [Clostridia bacterium]|nr:ATP-binding protein [Clostridia bacterium]
MLVNFRFKNFRSFYEDTEISLEATKDNAMREINTFSVDENVMPKDENELLKSAVIFGGNASGKSNVIKALAYMKNVILLSASQLPIVQQNETFAFYDTAIQEDSMFEVEFIYNNTFYRYGFILNFGVVKEEWLDKRVERLTPVFKRTEKGLDIVGPDKVAAKLINLAPNALFLSVGKNFHLDIMPALNDVMAWFQNLLIVFENNANSLDIYTMEGGKYRARALKILKLADIGIRDIKVKKDKIVNMADLNDVLRFNAQLQIHPPAVKGQLKQEENNLFNIDMLTEFDVFDEKTKRVVSKKNVMLFKDRGFNSEGTERLLCYLGWMLAALDQGRVILIDEIDAKLHFLVADYLIKLFNSIDNNPKNAQLVCTAHNVMLMDEDLRRDQIYFTSKDAYGESRLVALSDYKNVRKENLFSKRYLAGFYSKLPDMTRDW